MVGRDISEEKPEDNERRGENREQKHTPNEALLGPGTHQS
jgi:hypothetical protein